MITHFLTSIDTIQWVAAADKILISNHWVLLHQSQFKTLEIRWTINYSRCYCNRTIKESHTRIRNVFSKSILCHIAFSFYLLTLNIHVSMADVIGLTDIYCEWNCESQRHFKSCIVQSSCILPQADNSRKTYFKILLVTDYAFNLQWSWLVSISPCTLQHHCFKMSSLKHLWTIVKILV